MRLASVHVSQVWHMRIPRTMGVLQNPQTRLNYGSTLSFQETFA